MHQLHASTTYVLIVKTMTPPPWRVLLVFTILTILIITMCLCINSNIDIYHSLIFDGKTFVPTKFILRKDVSSRETKISNNAKHQSSKEEKVSEADQWLTYPEEGRIGNIMSEYASSYCLAKKTNRTLRIPANLKILKLFPNILSDSETVLGVPSTHDLVELKENCSTPITAKAINSTPRPVKLCCFLQSWKYLEDCERDIHWLFAPTTNVLKEVRKVLELASNKTTNMTSLKEDKYNLACIHIRRTDTATPELAEYGYNPTSLEYLRNAMDFIKLQKPDMSFLVFSDDPQWCLKNVTPLRNDIQVFNMSMFYKNPVETLKKMFPEVEKESRQALFELHLRAMCSVSIITSGTFGWWGAWLSGGLTTRDKNHPVPNSELAMKINKTRHYPPTWVPL